MATHPLTLGWRIDHAARKLTPQVQVPDSVPERLRAMARGSGTDELSRRWQAGELKGRFADTLQNIEVGSFTWEWHQPEGF